MMRRSSGKMRDVGILRVAGPGDVLPSVGQRIANGVQAFHIKAILADLLEHGGAHAGHDAHVRDDIGAVADLDAILRDGRAKRPHAKGNHVKRAAAHASAHQAPQAGFHLIGIFPIVRRSGFLFAVRADEGALLDTGRRRACRIGREWSSDVSRRSAQTPAPESTISCRMRWSSASEPSHRWTSSGSVSAAISATHD